MKTRIEDDIHDPNAPVEGARRVYFREDFLSHGFDVHVWIAKGWLMPRASPEVLRASPGIQRHSIPDGDMEGSAFGDHMRESM